ncbi:hypothetical protein BBP40_005782 [Aspergillus hancockii]|nr:hypothetical protein BBP40_005782 [Aspergillus hancockii]
MSLLRTKLPPPSRVPYVIPQLEGERITIPGSKGVFHILASSKQTNSLMAVFQSGAVLSGAPGFHYHNHAHDVFLVPKGYLKLWNGDKCRIMGPGEFCIRAAGPHTEIFGLIAPATGWTFSDMSLSQLLIPKVMAAKEKFDVVFQPNYQPPELGDCTNDDEQLTESQQAFYLRANTGPQWMLGGVMSRPFITATQSNGVCAISSIESSNEYSPSLFSKHMIFHAVDHCPCIQEGALIVRLKGSPDAVFREGETIVIPAGQAFALAFDSKCVRVWTFTDGNGIETLVHRLGKPFESVVLPDKELEWDSARIGTVGKELDVDIDV